MFDFHLTCSANKKDRSCACLFVLVVKDSSFIVAVISARKGRARAHPVGETARAKKWQPSQNTTET